MGNKAMLKGRFIKQWRPVAVTKEMRLMGNQYNEVVVIVRNALGQEVMRTSFNNTNAFKLNIPGVPGLYMLELHAPEHKALLRVLKN
jgi:hypothetical protein